MEDSRHFNGRVGRIGESETAAYLAGQGHRILERNWRCDRLEVDLITYDGDGIHFVEVKTRCSDGPAEPEERVTTVKQRRICAAAKRYLNHPDVLRHNGIPDDAEVHFDVAAVVLDENGIDVRFIPDAYIPIFV